MKTLAKAGLYAMFLNYYFVHIMLGHMLPFVTYFAYATMALYLISDRFLYLDKENKYWLIYLALSLLTAVFALNTSFAISSIVKFAQRLLIIITVTKICEDDGSIDFALELMTVIAVLCAGAVLLNLGSVHGRLTLDNDANLSVNDVGSILAYGCFTVILVAEKRFNRNVLYKQVFLAAVLILLVSVMFLAGSRKAFYAVVLLLGLLILSGTIKIQNKVQVFSLLLVGIVAWLFVSNKLLPMMEETSLYARLWGYKAEEAANSDEGRFNLYITAFKDFLSSPIWGLGFNNYAVKHLNYTHSTYADPIACSGVISLFYLTPYFGMLKKQLYLARNSIDWEYKRKNRQLLSFYLMFLFIGVGIPYLYKDIPCILLGMMVAHQRIEMYNGIVI